MYENILLPVDLGEKDSWKKTLPTAIGFCESMPDAVLRVMTVVPGFGMSIVGQHFPKDYEKEISDKMMKQLKKFVKVHVPSSITVQHVVCEGSVYKSILNISRKTGTDLIIMAAHSSTQKGIREFLTGPNSEQVMRHAHCSVLLVR